jgi:catechol 2,3-dioxygenase-like lactoylglutathione lyase family enzyme
MKNPFSHVDLTVADLKACLPFYESLLPELGFCRTFHSPAWKVFAAEGDLPEAAYFAITEDPAHVPNSVRIGFWAESPAEVDRITGVIQAAGGVIEDGPRLFPISPSYYAVFFQDPEGNRFEFMYRQN